MPQRKAANVLPEPVGADSSTCSPEAIAGQACSWAAVGAANARANQSRVAGLKPSSAEMPAAVATYGEASALPRGPNMRRVAHQTAHIPEVAGPRPGAVRIGDDRLRRGRLTRASQQRERTQPGALAIRRTGSAGRAEQRTLPGATALVHRLPHRGIGGRPLCASGHQLRRDARTVVRATRPRVHPRTSRGRR